MLPNTMTWFSRQNELDDAIARGDLELAIEQWRRHQTRTRRWSDDQLTRRTRSTKRLTTALTQRANTSIANGNLFAAWNDLSLAAEIALPTDQDAVSRQTNELVNLTTEQAESQLRQGHASRAIQLIDELAKRKIMDWRADRIRNLGELLKSAKQFAGEGKFDQSIKCLERAYQQQPEMDQLPKQIDAHRKRQGRLNELTRQLQSLALACRWKDVNDCCQDILALAPRHEIAVAAKRHSLQRIKKQTSAGSRLTNVPSDSHRVTDSNSFFQFDRAADGSFQPASNQPEQAVAQPAVDTLPASLDQAESVLIWIDGVGGFLVCLKPIVLIGQAKDQAPVTIALQADLRQRHARIEMIAGQHLVQPLGPIQIDGKSTDAAFVLKHDQVLTLGDGVKLKYSQPHPLSKTAKLDFITRHRTRPWSDAVLLASQSIILGPNPNNHVFCPHWKSDVVLFCRNGRWYCRSKRPFRCDGEKSDGDAELGLTSHVAGEDFSLSLEPVAIPTRERHGN